MQNFQNTFEIHKRSFISVFSICMTAPLNISKKKGVKFVNISIILQFVVNFTDCFQKSLQLVNKMISHFISSFDRP